ncbi:uncharacterized protein LOC143464758 isoform X1 [Clavelina lepadiformis]|uniref:uncharacterized protein LOC143464758 isoform X1 n=1 Tax=Clavelina lepadiformis TaxID=159417 RepID=UPI00404207FC
MFKKLKKTAIRVGRVVDKKLVLSTSDTSSVDNSSCKLEVQEHDKLAQSPAETVNQELIGDYHGQTSPNSCVCVEDISLSGPSNLSLYTTAIESPRHHDLSQASLNTTVLDEAFINEADDTLCVTAHESQLEVSSAKNDSESSVDPIEDCSAAFARMSLASNTPISSKTVKPGSTCLVLSKTQPTSLAGSPLNSPYVVFDLDQDGEAVECGTLFNVTKPDKATKCDPENATATATATATISDINKESVVFKDVKTIIKANDDVVEKVVTIATSSVKTLPEKDIAERFLVQQAGVAKKLPFQNQIGDADFESSSKLYLKLVDGDGDAIQKSSTLSEADKTVFYDALEDVENIMSLESKLLVNDKDELADESHPTGAYLLDLDMCTDSNFNSFIMSGEGLANSSSHSKTDTFNVTKMSTDIIPVADGIESKIVEGDDFKPKTSNKEIVTSPQEKSSSKGKAETGLKAINKPTVDPGNLTADSKDSQVTVDGIPIVKCTYTIDVKNIVDSNFDPFKINKILFNDDAPNPILNEVVSELSTETDTECTDRNSLISNSLPESNFSSKLQFDEKSTIDFPKASTGKTNQDVDYSIKQPRGVYSINVSKFDYPDFDPKATESLSKDDNLTFLPDQTKSDENNEYQAAIKATDLEQKIIDGSKLDFEPIEAETADQEKIKQEKLDEELKHLEIRKQFIQKKIKESRILQEASLLTEADLEKKILFHRTTLNKKI